MAYKYILLSLLLISCGTNAKFDALRDVPDCANINTTIEVEAIGSYELHIPEEVPSFIWHRQLLQVGDSTYYAYSDRSGQCIFFFNLASGQFAWKSCIDDFRFKQIKSFYVHTPDSIFAAVSDFDIALLDKMGKAKSFWPLIDFKEGEIPNHYLAHDWPALAFDGQLLFVVPNAVDLWLKSPEDRPASHFVFDIASKNKRQLGKYYGIYAQETGKREYPIQRCFPHTLLHGDSVLVSLPMSHEIMVYKKDGTAIGQVCAASSTIGKLADFMSPEGSVQEQINFQVENAYYGALSYHSELGVFSRPVEHAMELKGVDGKLNSPIRRQRSLLIFDKSLNKIGECPLQKGWLMDGKAIATASGYLLPVLREDENSIKLLDVKIKI